jgi:hypothetical protein
MNAACQDENQQIYQISIVTKKISSSSSQVVSAKHNFGSNSQVILAKQDFWGSDSQVLLAKQDLGYMNFCH